MKTSIVIAAGALCLLAAPAAASPRQYNRGYHDCLAGRYDEDEARSRAYRDGCRDAEREQGRGGEPSPGGGWSPNAGPRPQWGPGGGGPGPEWGPGGGPGPRPNGGGPGPAVPRAAGIPNVKGMDPGRVLATMANAGYRNVGTEVSGAAIYGFYFNPATGECVQVAAMNGRAVGAVPTSNPRCR